ncbi:MAG: NUDIX domain-containing protein [Alloprevotella sp.]|nr:NUDIX domain-containing protein [Alloprevotella sp.]
MEKLSPHPLAAFRYCPRCGADFHEHDARSKRCPACGFTYYCNASAATVAVVTNARDELLVVRRAQEPAKGTLDLPGGFVDPGESATEGVVREVMEETGARAARVKEFLFSLPNAYLFSGFEVPTCDLFFRVEITDETALFARDDAAELFWLPWEEVVPADFGLRSIRRGVERLLAERGR